MAISSINFKAVASNSEAHNKREIVPDYVLPNVKEKNKYWQKCSIAERVSQIESLYQEKVGQKIQKRMIPIREAVLNLDKSAFLDKETGKYNMESCWGRLNKVKKRLGLEYGIITFQAYVHMDEGKKDAKNAEKPPQVFKRNLHAHMLFDWQDKSTGKMIKLGKRDLSKIQTIVAEELNMERGVVWSKSERLEHKDFREAKEKMEKELLQLGRELQEKKLRLQGLIQG